MPSISADVETEEAEDEEHERKTFTFWKLFNYKTGNVRFRKTKPKESKVSPYEVPVQEEATIIVPKKTEYKAKSEIEVGEEKVKQMVVDRM